MMPNATKLMRPAHSIGIFRVHFASEGVRMLFGLGITPGSKDTVMSKEINGAP